MKQSFCKDNTILSQRVCVGATVTSACRQVCTVAGVKCTQTRRSHMLKLRICVYSFRLHQKKVLLFSSKQKKCCCLLPPKKRCRCFFNKKSVHRKSVVLPKIKVLLFFFHKNSGVFVFTSTKTKVLLLFLPQK